MLNQVTEMESIVSIQYKATTTSYWTILNVERNVQPKYQLGETEFNELNVLAHIWESQH